MKRSRIAIVGVLLIVVLILSGYVPFRVGSSGGNTTEKYEGQLLKGEVKVRFAMRLDPLPFLLNSFQNKYKLVQIFAYSSGQRVKLSAEKDKIELMFKTADGEARIHGILDLGISDPNFWDSLDNNLRNVLAYPQSIMQYRPEVICVFVPAEKVEAIRGPGKRINILPQYIIYEIDDLEDEVYIGRMREVMSIPPRDADQP